MWLHALADADPRCGGKATQLARLIRAQLPVPDGFVLDDRAFRHAVGALDLSDDARLGHELAAAAARIATVELPAALVQDVERRAAVLGVVAVRSSATIEDGAAGAAAGVFSSRRAVPASDVWAAIRAVWASALTPLAAAYARRRGGTIAIGVIVQRFVEGEPVTIYTRPPGAADADELLVQRGERLARRRRSTIVHDADPGAAYAIAAEGAIHAPEGADVELIDADADGWWVVQARPIVAVVRPPRLPMPPMVLAPLRATGQAWQWDVAHNPDPLSPAQTGLIELVERTADAPWSMLVCAGFLFTTARADAPPPPRAPDTHDALAARATELEAAIARALEDEPTPPLAIALERYVAFYRIWAGELAPLIAAARARHVDEPARAPRPSSVEATLLAAARGELDDDAVVAALGELSPAWDVAVPTYGERPTILREAVARARAALGSAPVPRVAPPPPDEASRYRALVADLAERDDAWFARAQAMVRRSLLARADQLQIDRDDVCWLPLDDVVDADALDLPAVRRRAAGARAAAARAALWRVPLDVGGQVTEPEPSTAQAGAVLQGQGTGPTVSGRVVRLASLASVITVRPGEVIVAQAITPALAVTVVGCAALVSETGGLLDHGAAMARELGIPCVVGCRDAWTLLRDGDLVTVDGDRGEVRPASSGAG